MAPWAPSAKSSTPSRPITSAAAWHRRGASPKFYVPTSNKKTPNFTTNAKRMAEHDGARLMNLQRSSGILLHPTSLPNRFGIGDLGPSAHRFIEQLVAGGQKIWQVLPLGPTRMSGSPYQSLSSFAGNPLLISPELLAENGYLST